MSASFNFRPTVRFTAIIVCVVVAVLLLELFARLVYAVKDDAASIPGLSNIMQASLILDPYEMPSPRVGNHWVLRPGWEADHNKKDRSKGRTIRELVAQTPYDSSAAKALTQRSVFKINKQGFKGREIDPSHSRIRILNIGDSCTFGNGQFDYSISLERTLNSESERVEVINGGVQGYAPKNVILELDRFVQLKPEIVTLYIGWNSLFTQVPWSEAVENQFRIVWMLKHAYRVISIFLNGTKEHALELYNKEIHYKPAEQEIRSLETYFPPSLIEVEKIVKAFHSIGSHVVIITLPSLLSMNVTPSAKELEIAHLPEFTDNAAVLAKLVQRYNSGLRNLAKKLGAQVIDLDQWAFKNLQPPADYYSDSLHMRAVGLGMTGNWLGKELDSAVHAIEEQKNKRISVN